MSKKNQEKKSTNPHQVKNIFLESETEKSKTLILFGALLAISSIGLLIFVLSEKIFHLS